MTAERKRALLIMGVTFIIGVVIGVLATGMFARQFYHGRGGRPMDKREMPGGGRGNLTDRIYKTVHADSAQKKLMKPIIDRTMVNIDELQERSHTAARAELDSLKLKLRPILRDDQAELLEKMLSHSDKPLDGKGKHDRHR